MSKETMRAVQQTEWGGLDKLRLVDVPRPRPLPTEVLVRVKSIGINPIDLFTVFGRAYMNAVTLPHIPGWDIAGVVEQVGYGTTRFKVGDEVYGMPWFPRPASAYAEYAVAPARQLALKPKGVSFDEAAAVPLAGLTAWQMLVDVAKVGPGANVVINGAAGGVGHFAVQIAKSLGAQVTAVASAGKHQFVRKLGADRVIDYTVSNLVDEIKDADVVIELVGGDTCIQMLSTLRKGGLLVSAQAGWVPQLRDEAMKLGVRSSWYLVEPDHAGLEKLTELIERGSLKIEVSSSNPLEGAVGALEQVAQKRTLGKAVLRVS
ncbi:NADP-dependent oxidoreductase [Bradyrhizobium mercantei]|uniref:NADP-dependent oxidoreductase n=1 Tax=Bradyrhizobium mercantei TaxID=1904807 RepID=UPI001FDA5C91|nr:NADP-dependent oxidoreductase [Bradyrhizobium mercantei]